MSNITRNEGFTQVAVWQGTIVGPAMVAEFEQFFLNEMNVRVQFLEEVSTLPDQQDGEAVAGTGGRNDCFFAVHDEDTARFAVPRLAMGIRWIEDVYGNEQGEIYPARIAEYKSW